LPNSVPLANAETLVETPHSVKDAPADQQSKRKTPAQDKQPQRDEPAMQPVRLAQQQALQSEQAANVFQREASPKRKGGQPVLMMALGGLLVLILIVGGSVAYLNFGRSSRQQTSATHTSTQVAKSTLQAQITPTPVSIQARIPGAGQLLYGTTIPGSGTGCDTQGGKWVSTSGANISCNANGMTLNNSGSSQPAGVFLESMKSGELPSSYIVQAQVTIKPGSNGDFGIFFLAQQGPNPVTFAWMLNQSANTGQVNSYTSGVTGSVSPVTSPIPISQDKMGTTATIDVMVQGSNSHLFVNGTGYPSASGLGSSSGTFGLAADAGADVTFKNVAVYAAS
jgi:hypothetical protein